MQSRIRQARLRSASTRLSVSVCRISRPRPAPIAARTASSRRLAAARASKRFATFAQTSRSRASTAPNNIHDASFTSWIWRSRSDCTTRRTSDPEFLGNIESAWFASEERKHTRTGLIDRDALPQTREGA